MKLSLTKFYLVAVVLAAVVPAFAGPMPMAEKNVAPMAPSCDWTGLYIGVNAGVTQLQSSFTDLDDWSDWASITKSSAGFIGGGQIGYNYQWRDLVLGIEADFSGSTVENHSFSNEGYETGEGEAAGYIAEAWDQTAEIDFMITLRGKLGISFLDNKAMIYVTGGGAYAHGRWHDDWLYYPATYGDDYKTDWHGDDWRWGWTGGFGLEYALNCHWSVRAEALYTWFADDTTHITGGEAYGPGGEEPYNNRVRFSDDMWTYRVGINYKFTGFLGAH